MILIRIRSVQRNWVCVVSEDLILVQFGFYGVYEVGSGRWGGRMCTNLGCNCDKAFRIDPVRPRCGFSNKNFDDGH